MRQTFGSFYVGLCDISVSVISRIEKKDILMLTAEILLGCKTKWEK